MSEDWRHQLFVNDTTPYVPHHGLHTPTYPACEMYDIDKVEGLLIKTSVAQRFPQFRERYSGTTCSECNEKIRENRLRFNQAC
jgi:hypothetical protein